MGRPKGRHDLTPRKGPDGLTKEQRAAARGVPLATDRRSGVNRIDVLNLPQGGLLLVEEGVEVAALLVAMDRYKVERSRPFPTWREVLAVVHSLGYRKVEPAGPLPRLQSPEVYSGHKGGPNE